MHFKVCLLPFLCHRARITAVTLCSHDTRAIPGLLVCLIVPWINLIASWGLRLLKVCCLELMLFPVTTIKSQLQQRNKTFNNPLKNIVILFHKNLFFFFGSLHHSSYSSPKPRLYFLSSSFNYKYQYSDSLSRFVFCYPKTLNLFLFSSMLSWTSS